MDTPTDTPQSQAQQVASTEAVVIDGPHSSHPSTPFITTLLANGVLCHATDIHIRPRDAGPVLFRARGRLQVAKNWPRAGEKDRPFTDDQGRLITHDEFDALCEALLSDGKGASTVVYRLMRGHQVRVEYVPTSFGKKLIVRLQPRTAPLLTDTFKLSPGTIDLLKQPKGLVLICGELGRGKTTLASSITSYWASSGRHVFAIEDPVEYINDRQDLGEISYINCRFLSEDGGKNDSRPTLSQVIPSALRSDIDALQLGEIRTPESLALALELSNAGKPVTTTYHAGSIGSALTRIYSMASRSLGPDIAKLTIAQALHCVLYASLAYKADGSPVPLVLCLPVVGQALRRTIATSNPETMIAQIENALDSSKNVPGAITRDMAVQFAIQAGATPDSAKAALPPKLDFTSQT